jgi:hypothetical protein
MRSGISKTNGNKRQKQDEDRNINIDERKPAYKITNDKLKYQRRLYAMKLGSPKPFFIRAAELLGRMNIDGRKVEKTPDYIRQRWVKEVSKSGIRGLKRSAINTKKGKRLFINI